MLTEEELNDMNEVIQDYCASVPTKCDEGCNIAAYCDNCHGNFGPQHPDDTIDAYNYLTEHKLLTTKGKDIEIGHDNVNHPSHYTNGGIECLDAIQAALSSHVDAYCAFLTGQVLKYAWRWPMKNGIEDCRKAKFYLDRLIAELELPE